MAIAHHIPPTGDVISLNIIPVLTRILYSTQKFADLVLGIVGVAILSIILIVLMPFVYGLLLLANRRLESKLKPIYNWINDADEKDLRDVHLIVERKNKEYRPLLAMAKIIDKNPITMGVSSQVNKMGEIIMNLEDSLKKAAYPNIEKKYSDKELKELESLFPSCEDWKDESLNAYEMYL